jgi:cell division protein FtsQ
MADGGAFDKLRRRPVRLGDASASIVRRVPRVRPSVEGLVPTSRSLAVALAILLASLVAWVVARETSLFAVRAVRVDGASPAVALRVKRVVAPDLGRSLLKIDAATVEAAVERIPWVAHASVDRAFPHGLRIAIVQERGVALVRRGAETWVVSSRGRVIRSVAASRRSLSRLPRIWVTGEAKPAVGEIVAGELATAARAVVVASEAGFRARVSKVVVSQDTLTVRLRSGLELLLGAPTDADLKLAVASRVMPKLADGTVYLDVSVPERPVASTVPLPQVEDESSPKPEPSRPS